MNSKRLSLLCVAGLLMASGCCFKKKDSAKQPKGKKEMPRKGAKATDGKKKKMVKGTGKAMPAKEMGVRGGMMDEKSMY